MNPKNATSMAGTKSPTNQGLITDENTVQLMASNIHNQYRNGVMNGIVNRPTGMYAGTDMTHPMGMTVQTFVTFNGSSHILRIASKGTI